MAVATVTSVNVKQAVPFFGVANSPTDAPEESELEE